tara:strand:- start:9806 stop:10486 length:681 start_codon:yes stop_codon:yes gene_type:complete
VNKPNARTYGGITVAHFGGSGDIRTNLTSAELTDLEILVGDFDVKTALVMGAELEPLTIALHYISGARATAGVGAFGSWHDPYGPRMKATVPVGLNIPMFETTSSDPAMLESVVNDSFDGSSLDVVVDMGTSSLARPGAFWSLLPRMSPGARYLLRRITPKDISAKIGTAQLESPDIVARVTAIPSYDVAVLSYEASLRLPDATSPISRITLGRSWVTIELATSEV